MEHEHNHDQQELMFKFAMFEQQMKQIQEQLEAVDRAIVDSASLSVNLEDIKGGKNKDIVASIGRGIFANAKLTSDELLVDIGGKNLVKKNIAETQKLIGEQVKKLETIKQELEKQLEEINSEVMRVFAEAQGKQ